MLSPDWAGRAPVYMIHFSSYRRIENARIDAKRLSDELGIPAHVLSIQLGAQGSWYRVMMGEFPTEEDALARRRALQAAGTSGMGLVYRVTGPSAP
jgi:cell division protein FtsN